MITLEKRTISYLSVSARIRVIDPFTQMKREYNNNKKNNKYNKILDDADLLRIAFTLSLLRALHDALRETFFEVTNNEMYTAKRYRNQLWVRTDFNNNCLLCYTENSW